MTMVLDIDAYCNRNPETEYREHTQINNFISPNQSNNVTLTKVEEHNYIMQIA
jgi:hypothetical protein